jgi:hypothetical protein
MGFMDSLLQLLGRGPSQQAAQSVNVDRANQSRMLEDQYTQASADPSAGMGLTPAMQQLQENELAQGVRSRMSSAGAGRSGAANDSVQKAIVDYRIAQMGKRQAYLDSLRSGMLTASTPQVEQPSAAQSSVSRFTTQAAGSLANSMFGPDADQQYGQRGGMNVQPTGQDPRGQGPNGPNGRGANNAGSYGT